MVFYESVHRIEGAIAALCGVFGTNRSAYLGRELTKMHEQCVYGTLGEIHAQLLAGSIIKKGEFVIVVGGSLETKASSLDLDSLLVELSGKLPDKEVAQAIARATGEKRNALYQRLLELKKS